ncbi:glycosyl hydrolase family 28-related protein [Hymenobacter radiodurans]|uniref:glycosyl hydrolase family 28-related protein n=1 Tax=Hymenobacter radiodurans TaxID=2496028 RepID=UPI0014046CA4|nr:glycosyl hydrolase family 28-related protein [Hymenobacter radiodurans]
MEQPLTVIERNTNTYDLPVGWGHKYNFTQNIYNVKTDSRLAVKAVGDGITNDKPAIQTAISMAKKAGGGIIFFPEGIYKLLHSGWGGLELGDRVILAGEGIDKTVLRYGYPGESGVGVRLNPGVKTTGLADLTIENISDGGHWASNLSASGVEEFFMQRVCWKLNQGRWLDIADANKVCIVNCDFTQGVTATTGYRGPLRMDGSQNVVYADNKMVYANDGLHFGHTRERGGAQNIVFENNKTYRDGSARWPRNARVITHVTTWNFARNVAILNNTFHVINGRPQNTNDGETILSEQGANYAPDESVGTVSSATSNTLTDNTKAWGIWYNLGLGSALCMAKGWANGGRLRTGPQPPSPWKVIGK